MKKERLVYLSLIVILIVILLLIRSCNKPIIEQTDIYNKLQDSISYFKDKYGVEHAKISVLEASNVNTMLKIKSNDATVIKLQETIKQYKNKLKETGSSVVIIGSESNVSSVTATIIQPVKNGDTCNPTYTTVFEDKWLNYSLQAGKDSTKLNLTIKNSYSVVIGSERPKWYKKKQTFIDVSNENPYDKIKTTRAFQVKDTRKHRVSLGVQAGYGFTLTGVQPYIGVGVQFNILNL